ncbi:urea transporter [Arthrobacter sp. 35W]|uniref:urea transporter n=1 Tax=Arthrobacter sp. 35W TaxID=1132441 RepID=UPI00041B0CA2|nr:urea transporter [Arthrobacter sp. 35W]
MVQPLSFVRQWGSTVGRGLSQIFFHTKIPTGLLILAACVVQDWRMAVLVVLGSLASSMGGCLVGFSTAGIRNGLQGFCGALAGAAAFAGIGGVWQAYPIAVVGGLLCAPVTWAMVWVFSRGPLKALELPPTTAPFCIVATGILWATGPLHTTTDLLPARPTDLGAFVQSLLTNISQVVLVDSFLGGGLILAGLFLAGWKVGLAALLGSAVGSLCALAMNVNLQQTGNGLAGYSGVLTAIAFAVVFNRGTWEPWLLAVAGTGVTAVVTLVMHRLAGPTYTWPYILTLWAGLAVVHFVPRLHRYGPA